MMGRYRTPLTWSTIQNRAIGWNMNTMSLRAIVFGELVKLANPMRMSAHVSDLYYDALWLADRLDVNGIWEQAHFYFGTRDTGTQIDINWTHIAEHNSDMYKVAVIRKNLGHRGPAEWEYTLTIKRAEQN